MPAITFDLSVDHIDRLVDAFCGLYGYDDNKAEGESRSDFSLRHLRKHLVRQTRRWEQKVANDATDKSLTIIDVT